MKYYEIGIGFYVKEISDIEYEMVKNNSAAFGISHHLPAEMPDSTRKKAVEISEEMYNEEAKRVLNFFNKRHQLV